MPSRFCVIIRISANYVSEYMGNESFLELITWALLLAWHVTFTKMVNIDTIKPIASKPRYKRKSQRIYAKLNHTYIVYSSETIIDDYWQTPLDFELCIHVIFTMGDFSRWRLILYGLLWGMSSLNQLIDKRSRGLTSMQMLTDWMKNKNQWSPWICEIKLYANRTCMNVLESIRCNMTNIQSKYMILSISRFEYKFKVE